MSADNELYETQAYSLTGLPHRVNTATELTGRGEDILVKNMTESKIRNITVPMPYENTGNFRFMGKVKSMFDIGQDVWLLDDENRIVVYNTEARYVCKTIHLHESVPDFSLCRDNMKAWYCSQTSNTVGEIESDQKIVRFTVDKKPLSLCVTADYRVVVGMVGVLTIYTPDGAEVTSATSTEDYVVRTPHRIAECPSTNNLAVIDMDWKSHGGDQRSRVVIFDKLLKILHIYFGRRKFPELRPDLDRIELAYSPRGVFYNKDGELFVSDFYNHSVIRLSGTGTYEGEYHNYMPTPTAICNKSADELWVLHQHDWVFGYIYR
ncbi:uncharacterized protein LOC132545996 [Ylistrum balloti]|uniref:uncharacterized protein LOC132545996 n=1 Tax=Ylistrum balloti TaxID=509963 RepID=UPI00290584B1|nr:uncharacterized protein LOC132545996 [Ylistrum balloti]